MSEHLNIEYIEYYKNLRKNYVNDIERKLKDVFKSTIVYKIRAVASADQESKLGADLDLRVNPSPKKPIYIQKLEFQRVKITRYRTGAHKLKIELNHRNPLYQEKIDYASVIALYKH